MNIAAGEIEEEAPINDGKEPAVKAFGAKGGAARTKAMTPERRAEIAKAAAAKRWKFKNPGITLQWHYHWRIRNTVSIPRGEARLLCILALAHIAYLASRLLSRLESMEPS